MRTGCDWFHALQRSSNKEYMAKIAVVEGGIYLRWMEPSLEAKHTWLR